MKRLMQIAIDCDLTYNQINDIVRRQGIVPTKVGKKKFVDVWQEDLIHQALYFDGKLTEITLESKINTPETFEEFKRRTYGIINDVI